jgi:hypothetical protein
LPEVTFSFAGVRNRAAPLIMLAVALALVSSNRASGAIAARTCGAPNGSLCRSFAFFRRPARSDDRLPRNFLRDPPIRHVEARSARRLHARGPNGYDFYAAAGKRLVCLLVYHRAEHGGGFNCSNVALALSGRMFLDESCGAGARRHRLLHAQLLPDGVKSATITREGRPAMQRRVRDDLLVADLPVPSHDYLPTSVAWKLHAKQYRLSLPVDDMAVTCMAPQPAG